MYLSIDKDVLCTEAADTSWSQGELDPLRASADSGWDLPGFSGRISAWTSAGRASRGRRSIRAMMRRTKAILALLEREGVTYEE